MQLGCDHCGFLVNPLYLTHQPGPHKCPECGTTLRQMKLPEALELAREAEEARAWRADSDASAENPAAARH